MTVNPMAATLRMKKISLLIRDARQKKGASVEQCATALGISTGRYESFENAEGAPTLPELELLAFYLEMPLETFLGRSTAELKVQRLPDAPEKLIKLRQRAIGVLLMQARLQNGITHEDLSERTGIPAQSIKSYEAAETPAPMPELEILSRALNRSLKDFQDQRGPVGRWVAQQNAMAGFLDLPAELQVFVSKPINRPFLEVARRLSEMSAEKLRSVAESILEITL
jgi:transcriptional regulator with XRE-family HTH domain